jgi:hypothetical protein
MTPETFDCLIEMIHKRSKGLLQSKAKDYARDTDRMMNFHVGAERSGKPPEIVLKGYRDKHETAMEIALRDLEAGRPIPPFDKWQEWIGDSLNYLILLEALLVERFDVEIAVNLRADAELWAQGGMPAGPMKVVYHKAAPAKPAPAKKARKR